jgi:phosphoribosylaminoimidazolecarboxamide formyltransferase/IMP cyclohydrolase
VFERLEMVVMSDAVDHDMAAFVNRIVADAIVAPGFEPGVISKLAAKKTGHFLIFKADAAYVPQEWESREVF